MKKKNLLIAALLLASSALFSACSTTDEKGLDPKPAPRIEQNQNGKVELSANTKVVNEESNSKLTGIDEEKLVFSGSTEFLESVKAGDILVAAPNQVAVDGYLRSVIKVERSAGALTVYTMQAKLEQAIKNGNISVRVPVAFNKDQKEKLEQSQAFTQNFSQSIPLNYVIYDRDGNQSTTIDQIRTSGSLTFGAAMFLDMNIVNNQLTYFRASTNFNLTHNQSLIAGGSLSASGSIRVFNSVLPSLTFSVGVLPITVRPTMEVFLGYTGSTTAQVTFGYKGTASAQPVIQFQNGAWGYTFSRNISATRNPVTANASATLTGLIKPRVTMALYGCTCASAYIQGEIYLTLKSSLTPVSSSLTAGVKGGAGANLFGYSPSNNSIFNLPINL